MVQKRARGELVEQVSDWLECRDGATCKDISLVFGLDYRRSQKVVATLHRTGRVRSAGQMMCSTTGRGSRRMVDIWIPSVPPLPKVEIDMGALISGQPDFIRAWHGSLS